VSVDVRDPVGQAPGHPAPRPARARWILPIRPLQAAVWEIAALAVVLALTLHHLAPAVVITIVAVSGALFAVTSARVAGHHLLGWTSIWLAFRLRRHDNRRDSPDPLHRIAGAVRVRQHVDRAGNRFGVAEVDGGWSAIVRLTGQSSAEDPRLLMSILRTTYERVDIPLASAQLLTWTMSGGEGSEPLRAHWLTVRYRPDEAPIAALARGGGSLGALRSTACAALALMGLLAEAGYESTVLEAGELADELRVALGADRQAAEITDSWSSWSAGPTAQTCYTTSSGSDAARVLGGFVKDATFTAASYTLRRAPGGKERADVTLRVGGGRPPTDLGARVVPLHGRHASAVRRTLPLALES
jgi:type VII secretion protein EccE